MEFVQQHAGASFWTLANQTHIKLEERKVITTSVLCEINTVAVAQSNKKGGILDMPRHWLFAPTIKRRPKLGSKVAQHNKFGTRKGPF